MKKKEWAAWTRALRQQLIKISRNWLERGGGSLCWGYPVVLEPPFNTFAPTLPQNNQDIANGSYIIFRKEHLPKSFSAEVYDWSGIQIIPSPSLPVTKQASQQFLLSLSELSRVSFEIIGTAEKIVCQMACLSDEQDFLAEQIRARFIQTTLDLKIENLAPLIEYREDRCEKTAVIDFGLEQPFVFPLKTWGESHGEIWPGIVNVFSRLGKGEVGVLQILFTRTVFPWVESLIQYAQRCKAEHILKEKINTPLYAVVVRLAVQSESHDQSLLIARRLGLVLNLLDNPGSNRLVEMEKGFFDRTARFHDFFCRTTERSGMILNSEELATLVHLPPATVQSRRLVRADPKKTKRAPACIIGNTGQVLGFNVHENERTVVTLSAKQRLRHTYIVGTTGMGKSSLLQLLLYEDIAFKKNGVAVLDPHGLLIDSILPLIPKNRCQDVVLFDPTDEKYPLSFNILAAHSQAEKNLLASDLVGIFQRFSTSWGDQMTSVLANAVIAFLESKEGGTLNDLKRFLIDKNFRNQFLKTVQDSEVINYWEREFPLLGSRKSIGPLLTRLDTFLRPKVIRNILCQKGKHLDLTKVMDEGKICLAKLSIGAIGEENAYILGSLLITKFYQLAMARQSISEKECKDFYFYIDEFHNFLTPTLASILSGARKYHFGLVLAHQELRQLHKQDSEIASSVLANPCTRICFKVGDDDAIKLAQGFSFFDADDLKKLNVGEAICRVERSDYDFNLNVPLLKIKASKKALNKIKTIRALSRRNYASPLVQEVLAKTEEDNSNQTIQDKKSPLKQKPAKEKTASVATDQIQPFFPKEMQEQKPKGFSRKDDFQKLPGKGGNEHKDLQKTIKSLAEEKGYRATVEKEVSGGSIDVELQKDNQLIACEISVTTSARQEMDNLDKCLKVGYKTIVLVSTERKTLRKAESLAKTKFVDTDYEKLLFMTPEELFALLENLSASSPTQSENLIKGYKVKISHSPLSKKEKEERKQSIFRTIWESMKRKEKK